jgi:hypothetical protein
MSIELALNVFTGFQKQHAASHRHDAKREHGGEPDFKIHRNAPCKTEGIVKSSVLHFVWLYRKQSSSQGM